MYLEGLGSASVVNGVLRVETSYRNAKGDNASEGDLMIPANRVVAVVEGLQALVEKLREQGAAQLAAAAEALQAESNEQTADS